MYKLQKNPDPPFVMPNGSEVIPVATLKDEYGGVSHIIVDDHCYVLVNGSEDDKVFNMVYWWYDESVEALKTLPLPSEKQDEMIYMLKEMWLDNEEKT